MASDLTPDDVRRAHFKTSLRGLDKSAVEEFLAQAADKIEVLEGERERLRVQLADSGLQDLESEFEKVGQEVNSILQAARDAAESMRERASVDAARWRSEAMADAEEERRSAGADAEALRRDAWTVGTELLKQTQAEADRLREQAERDVLTTMGEAEREAHRLTSASRRDAEDLLRNATMDAEKAVSEANKRRDEIIDQANRQAAAAQERTRALEQRRDELLTELENVRATLTRLEGSLEEKRESLDLSAASSSVKVVPAKTEESEDWEQGETVRVVKPAAKPSPEPLPDAEVDVLIQSANEPELQAGPESIGEPDPDQAQEPVRDQAEEPSAGPTDEDVPGPAEPPVVDTPKEAAGAVVSEEGASDVDALFASLRDGGEVVTELDPQPENSPAEPTSPAGGVDWIAERDSRLLPITNRALRGIKKVVTDLQNIALDSLRTDDSWRPEPEVISEAVHAELTTVWSESFAAGHAVAEDMTGDKLKRPRTPSSSLAKQFGEALASEVTSAIEEAGSGQRERQSAASKVFRIWRTDEAERRVREAAIDAFERAIEKSVPTEAPVG